MEGSLERGICMMDPKNPIVWLCVQGMQAEAGGKLEAAHLLFTQAWEESHTDYEACVAAHYVARHQKTAEETLRWNQEALDRADLVKNGAVQGFYPSLYLNLAQSHASLGNREEAKKYYEWASLTSSALSGDVYGKTVRDAIARGLERVD